MRIGIIGAGPAGLSAAVALKQLGHTDVTVLERQDAVGGKCRSRTVDGEQVEAGAIYVLPHYPHVERLARRLDVPLVPSFGFTHRDAEGRERPFGVAPPSISLGAKVAEYGRFGRALLRHWQVLRRPLGEIDPEHVRALALPFGEWVQQLRLEHFHEVAYPLFRSFGFGYEEQQVPALYVFHVLPQLAPGGNFARLWDLSTLRLQHVGPGYAQLWQRLVERERLDVRTGVQLTRVQRSDLGAHVETSAGTFDFDRLIVAAPPNEALGFLDATAEERRLFSKVRWLDVWQLTLRLEGVGDALLLDANQTYARLGHTMIVIRYRPGSNLYYLFGYARPGLSDAQLEANALEDVAALGGKVLARTPLQRWPYFPHFGTADVADGCIAQLQALQGQQRTWYVGEVLSNIGVELAAIHAAALVKQAFGRADR